MNNGITYRVNTASDAQIFEHLTCCDRNFAVPLSERVDLHDYARKLAEKSDRFEAWCDGVLVGLVAVYCSDPQEAFISDVSVVADQQGRGIGLHLMKDCIAQVKAKGVGAIALDVDGGSAAALSIYGRCGFVRTRVDERTVRMHLNLEQDSE